MEQEDEIFGWHEYGVTIAFFPFDWHWRLGRQDMALFDLHVGPFYLRVGI